MPKKKKDITASQRTRRWHGGVAAINNASAATDIPDILAVWGKKLDLDMEGYNSLVDTTIVDAAIYAGIGVGGYASREELAAVAGPIISKRVIVERTLHLINSVSEPARYPILLKQYGQWLGVLGIDLTDFNRLFEGTPTIDDPPADATGKWAVYEAIYEDKPYDSEGDLEIAFDEAVATALANQAVAAVNAAEDEDEMGAALLAYADVLELLVGPESDYDILEAAGQAAVIEAVLEDRLAEVGYADAAAIKAAFDAAVEDELEDQAVAAVNSATAEEMGAVLVLYAVALTLDLTDYEALDEAKKGSVHEALVGKDFADAAAVKDAFDAAVTLAQGE
jgi:hypothetical protein